MTPILHYPGAKWRLAKWIIAQMPPHESYLEPYFGSGAIFFNKEPSRIETINDIDGEIVNFFKVCRDQPEELARVIALTPWAREEHRISENQTHNVTSTPVERARLLAVRCWMSHGGRQIGTNSWRHTTGKVKNGGPDNPKLWSRLPETVYQVAERLKMAQIENRPAVELISRMNSPEVLIYADPPYLMATRTLHGSQYRNEMTDTDHITLLDVLKAHKGPVLLSGYASNLYTERLQGWTTIETNTTAEKGVKRVESLWLNPCASRCAHHQMAFEGDNRYTSLMELGGLTP